MRYRTEEGVLAQADDPTKNILTLWHQECVKHLGYDMKIIVADRYENAQLAEIPGTINTGSPRIINNTIYLALWLESSQDIDPHILTHEVGHWILTLRGFKTILDPKRHLWAPGDVAINLNSLAQHPVVFALQRTFGHEPQAMIDKETANDITFYNQQRERDAGRLISDALYIADHLSNCSEVYRLRLSNVLQKRLPNVRRFVTTIMSTILSSKLDSPEGNLEFCNRITNKLQLGRWVEYDQLSLVKKQLQTIKQ